VEQCSTVTPVPPDPSYFGAGSPLARATSRARLFVITKPFQDARRDDVGSKYPFPDPHIALELCALPPQHAGAFERLGDADRIEAGANISFPNFRQTPPFLIRAGALPIAGPIGHNAIRCGHLKSRVAMGFDELAHRRDCSRSFRRLDPAARWQVPQDLDADAPKPACPPLDAENGALAAARRSGRKPDSSWRYETADGETAFYVVRWNGGDGRKVIRPLSWFDGDGWKFGAWPNNRPL
jgi:hypothetical protein